MGPPPSGHSYRPLRLDQPEIRLVTVAPGSGDPKIHCQLRHASLTDNPEYKALSYVWGDPSDTRPISLDGQVFQVTANLHAALRRLRHRTKKKVFWIDAICINRSAKRVVAWLGEADEDDRAGLGIMATMQQQPWCCKSPVGLRQYYSVPWGCLLGIFDRPYWKRVWVVQELVVARNCQIVCGDNRQSLEEYMLVIGILLYDSVASAHQDPVLSGADTLACTSMGQLILHYQNRKEVGLLELIISTSEFEATDPRDKIYALLGLSSTAARESITPEYCKSKTMPLVSADLVEYFIAKEESLDIILGNRPIYPPNPTAPSWIPLFDVELHYTSRTRCQWLLAAAGNFAPKAQISSDRKRLTARGYEIDTVVARFGPFRGDLLEQGMKAIGTIMSDLDEAVFRTLEVIRGHYEQEQGSTGGFTPMNDREALWRTLVCDTFHDPTNIRAVTTPAPPRIRANLPRPARGGRCQATADTGYSEPIDYRVPFIRLAGKELHNRCLFITKRGYLGMGPMGTELHDTVCILYGAHTPVMLRSCTGGCLLVGDTYIHGVMSGQDVTGAGTPGVRGDVQEKDFVLC